MFHEDGRDGYADAELARLIRNVWVRDQSSLLIDRELKLCEKEFRPLELLVVCAFGRKLKLQNSMLISVVRCEFIVLSRERYLRN